MKESRVLLRVTSIWYNSEHGSVFSGVAININGDNLSINKYFVVHANKDLLSLQPVKGQHWYVTGVMSERNVIRSNLPKVEVSIKASKLRVTLPNDENCFVRLIRHDNAFGGIGKKLASKIWIMFQSDIYKILSAGDIEKLKRVKGISDTLAQGLIEGWNKYENLKHLWWFEKHDIPSGIAMNLIKHHKEDSLQKIQDDPYRLTSFGLSYEHADKLALNTFDFATDSPERLIGAIESAQKQRMKDGHTVSTHKDLFPLVDKHLCDPELTSYALQQGYETAAFTIDEDGSYHPAGLWVMEQVVAMRLAKLAITDVWSHHYEEALSKALSNLPFPLTERQGEAVITSLSRGTSIIAGGAGTGKTTVLRVIMSAYMNLNVQVAAMALSGRAAKRITESTGFRARTVAGFLKNIGSYDFEKPTILVIDEASMIDLPTMFRIITKIPPTVRILLVGDPNQLSPIGAGLVLHAIVNVLPTVTLDIVKRQDGSTGIPEFTKLIEQGVIPDITKFGNNIRFHHVSRKDINAKTAELYAQDIENTQIVAAQRNGVGGVNQLNELCQSTCNPNGKRLDFVLETGVKHLKINEGDPVIFNENNWDRDVQNGTMGRLINVGNSHGSEDEEVSGFADVVLDDGRTIPLTHDLMDSIRKGFAITLHKAQGSQFKRVIVPLSRSGLIDNSWIYTALTRAEVYIELVGDIRDFNAAIMRLSSADKRDTYLRELLEAKLANLQQAA